MVSGQAGISSGGNTTIINQASQKAVINWQTFSVAAGGTVQFAQPDAKSITLNRVIGAGASAIDGTLTANGQVWILNPNGVLFGQGARVNVGGLLATTADIADSDFVAGHYTFDGDSGAGIVNNGAIHAANGGSVVLSAARVSNTGLVQADAGSVVLGGATAFTLDFTGDNLLRYAVLPSKTAASGAEISNSGKIAAAGGKVLLTARAAASVADGVINNTGIIEAVSAREVNGQIILDAGDGTVRAGGTLDVSGKAAGETGGSVQVLGKNVEVADGANMSASGDAGGGEILIGGNFRGQGPLANAETTTVGKATISADAITNGDGGQVVVWSDSKTRFGGAISARGGALSGNGGQVETSGAVLVIDPGATVVTLAAAGFSGNWLLDPDDLFIVDSGSEDTSLTGGVLAFDAPGTTIFTETIETALLNGDVTLQANNDITVQGSVNVESANTLELDAGRSIIFKDGGSLSNVGGGEGTIILSANDAGAKAANRVTGAGVISMESSSNSVTADKIDLIVGKHADGGGIGTGGKTVNAFGNVYIETAGYDAFINSYDLVLGTDHAMAVNLADPNNAAAVGNLTLTVTGLTQTAAIAVKDLTIGWTGDPPSTNPISLMNASNAISGRVTVSSQGGTFGGANQIEITNSQAITLGDLTVTQDAVGNGDYGAIQIVTKAGGITIDGAISGGGITLHAVGDIIETDKGAITSHGPAEGFFGGGLAVSSFEGKIDLSQEGVNFLLPGSSCVESECYPSLEQKLNPGQLAATSAGDAVFNFETPVGVFGVISGGDFSLKVSGEYELQDEFGDLQTYDSSIQIFSPVVAAKFITLLAPGDIVQMTQSSTDTHLKAIGLKATSDNGDILLDNGGNGGTDPGNQVGGDINGYVLLKSAGDTTFTNTVDTILGGQAYYPIDEKTGEQIPPLYPFKGTPTVPPVGYQSPSSTIGGNLKVTIVDVDALNPDHPVLVIAGRIYAENSEGGHSVLHASGDISNNDGNGTIIVGTDEGENNNLSLVSDFGDVGGDDGTSWAFGLGTQKGELNLHAEAKNGGIIINPGDLNFGIDGWEGGAIDTNYLLVFGNGTVTQNTDGSGRIDTGALDVHARGDITLNNAFNTVSGPVDFYVAETFDGEQQKSVASDITFHNSVDTLLMRAAGVSPDGNPDAPPLRAGNVTIIVDDPSNDTTPTLTLGNRVFTNQQGVEFVSSIDAEGHVLLEADGGIKDGYDPFDLDSLATAGHVSAGGTLTVIAHEGDISLANPTNAVSGGVDLRAGPQFDANKQSDVPSDITFANSVDTTIVRASGGTITAFSEPIQAGNVTILVSDPLGVKSPSLTLGSSIDLDEGDSEIVSSIEAAGNVVLLAGGEITDGYDPDNGESWPGAGHVRAGGSLTVTAVTDQIWLENPANSFAGLTATTENKDIRVTASSPNGELLINGITAGTGDVYLTVNDSHVVSPSGVIVAGDLTVSTHDTLSGNCQENCVPPPPFEIYLAGKNAVTGTVKLSSTGAILFHNTKDTVLGTSTSGEKLTVLSDGDLEIADGATLTGGEVGEDDTSVLLSAKGAFINNSGSEAIVVPEDWRWLVYSNNPEDNNFGGLDSGNTAIWNTVYDPDAFVSTGGNRYIFAYQPTITVTSTDVEKTFGDDATTEVANAYTITGLQEGVDGAFLGDDAENVYSGTPAVTSEGSKADANVEDSPYVITAANGSFEIFGGYGVSFVSTGQLTIDPLATLYYVADAKSRIYGQANPVFTGQVEGFLEGDTQQNSTTGTLAFKSTATGTSSVGSYAIEGYGLSSKNYAFAQDADNATALTITKATLLYDATEASRVYGQANPAFTGTVTGLANNETLASVTDGTADFTSTALQSDNVGSYAITGSGLTLTSGNYDLEQAESNSTALSITKATLLYDAAEASRVYGSANPTFSGIVTGLTNGDTLVSVTDGTAVFTSPALQSDNVGSYAINGSGLTLTSGNYDLENAASNAKALTITKATLLYDATEASRVYGSANPTFSGIVTGLVNNDTLVSVTDGTAIFTSTALPSDNVGGYGINGSGLTLTSGNYDLEQAASNATALTITKATLLYVADKVNRTYGENNPALTGTVTGFVNGDTLLLDTTGTLAFTSDATSADNVGSYAILGSGLSAQNYDIDQAAGNSMALTIDPAILTYNATLKRRIYGSENPSFDGTVTGFVNGDTQVSATDGTLVFTSDALPSDKVGSYAIDGSGLTADNYIFVQAESNATALSIDPATLTYIADEASRTYGAANPTFTGTVTGFVNGDTQATATDGTLVFTSDALPSDKVGSYAIDGSGLTADNYIFVQAEGNDTALTIDPATLTYTADKANRTYGSANPSFSGTVTGFVNGDTQATATDGTLVFTSDALPSDKVGSYAIDGSGLTADNYIFVQAESNDTALTIDPATLTYTADAASRTYGSANPAFSGSVTGFVNGDTQATATDGTLVFTSDALPSDKVGSYAIDGSGLTADNYVFVQAESNDTALTIDPATLTYTANAASRTYGSANPAFTGTVTGFVNGETQASATDGTLAFTSAALASDNVGKYAIDGSGLTAENYIFVQAASNDTALTVNPATLTYTANAASRTYGSANPSFKGTVTGFVNGDTQGSATTGALSFNSLAISSSNVGKYAINGSGLAAQNYVFVQAASNASAFTINPATLTISLTGTVVKVFDGTTTATLDAGNYSSLGGVFFNDDVSLAGLPTLGVYDDANVGTGRLVTVSGLTLTGAKAGNYVIASQVSGPVGVITASGPDIGGVLGPPLTGVVVTNTQSMNQRPGTVIDALNQSSGGNAGQGSAPPATPPGPPTAGLNPLEDLTVTSPGGQNAGEPPTPSESATAYIVETFDNGPPSNDSNVIIPSLLQASNGGGQGGQLDYGSIPGWGNTALWQ